MKVKTTYDNLVRDTSNHALINTNKEAYELYRHQRKNGDNVQRLENKIINIESEMSDIKSMLKQLLDREHHHVG